MNQNTYIYNKRFQLESGLSLPGLEIAYHTYGALNRDKSNVIWVAHALTANSDVLDWWKGLFGENELFDPEDYFIVCANNLGSCYGTTGPLSINPDTNEPWFSYFPQITIRDMANTLHILRQHLGIEKIHTLIGGSQGGQIAQEWIIQNSGIAQNLILIATNAQHSPWGIAFNESQRLAIKADRTYFSNSVNGGEKGLQAARSIALLSYRNYHTYNSTQKNTDRNDINNHAASSYQRYQGEKLVKRFNAYSYVRLSEAMDSHQVARERAYSLETVLNEIDIPTLVIGVTSDVLFPLCEQQLLARYIKNAVYEEIDSFHGHDGFLIETKQIAERIDHFYKKAKKKI
ncbi:MAG: metX [Bacteroidetes bacterium]|jgi:homoserine O-acetyltransferase|nr:metX [Bacteroidota bacterium]MDF2453144.1 metX [Bacteroidota bacterium]